MAKLFCLGIAAGLLVGVVAILWVAVPGTPVQAASGDEPYILSGVVVHYRVHWDNEGRGVGTGNDEGIPYRTVIIRENSIILIAEGGGGKLLPINDSLRSFFWTKQ